MRKNNSTVTTASVRLLSLGFEDGRNQLLGCFKDTNNSVSMVDGSFPRSKWYPTSDQLTSGKRTFLSRES